MGTIHLIPTAGLGNRMRVISSVYAFCLKHNAELIIHWHRQFGLNASFSSLFEPIPNIKLVDCSLKDYFNYNISGKYNLFIPSLINMLKNREAHYGLKIDELSSLGINNEIVISTYSQQGELYPISQLFHPVPKIQHIIDEFKIKMGDNTIGCHIRRTDNTTAKYNSSLDKFEQKISEQIERDPTTKIFICSDDATVKSSLLRKYGDRILIYNSTLTRNSYRGIRDAVVELWILSSTKEIWGSFWSSYTDIAIQINNAKYKIIK